MAVLLPHIEDSNKTNYFPPKGEYETFQDEAHYAEKVREWGLSSTKDVKKEFWYKEKTHQRLVTIKGYEIFGQTGEYNTIVIEFQDGNVSCIHPAYLKEMQSSSFGKELKTVDETDSTEESTETSKPKAQTKKEQTEPIAEESIVSGQKSEEKQSAVAVTSPSKKETKTKKEKPAKLVLPEDKVHFTATVKQFALSWNHFNEENDEVVVLENVMIEQEEPTEVGLAWCAHSKTLKKFELAVGDTLEFDGKIVKKSLPKGKDVEDEAMRLEVSVAYKINNPSKIVKK
ncbi:hypothetical protein [Neobacillus sp. D3-1R]|uniref:hypothetical protein n=1 Tax=Neobacillus sp. D3-1R TaxID=3445778 RepID=UPI003FA0303D